MCSLYLGENLISGQATLVGESRNIGQIIPSTIPLTDAGLHLLDGSLILGNGIYSDFVDYIASIYNASASYFCTEAQWQTSVTTYGVCGKFVYDSVNNTVRLPKYNSKIYTGGGTAPVVGNGTVLGLTDGTHFGSLRYRNDYGEVGVNNQGYGVSVGSDISSFGPNSFAGKGMGVTTDPTKTGIIAQLSDITTSLDGYYYIVIATSTKTDIQVDIDEIATDLNGKADTDLSNVPASKGILTESYVNGTSWYRVYSDGWCEQGGMDTYTFTQDRKATIQLLKIFQDTNYTLMVNSGSTTSTSYVSVSNSFNKTTSSFSYWTFRWDGNNGSDVTYWQACGYIEV